LPFQAKPSASTATRCIWPFHSRASMVPGFRFAARRASCAARCPASSGHRTIEQTLALLTVQITHHFGLQAVRQHAEQQVAGQVRVRPSPEYVMPTASKLPDVEIAQARNLAVECLAVQKGRNNPDARHGAQDAPGQTRAVRAVALNVAGRYIGNSR
jgi:hypothetical protein